jgi:hypothetical protein
MMKAIIFTSLFVVHLQLLRAQSKQPAPNVFIITLDGFRWQEIFNGADPELMADTAYVSDTAMIRQLYGGERATVRRQKLLPFFWNVLSTQGQLYGNRAYGNQADVKNFYKISYAGYNEIFTGYADRRFIPNTPRLNKNANLPAYLNTLDEFKGKVVAFSSWNIFPYILNEPANHFTVNSGYENLPSSDPGIQKVNQVQDSIITKPACRYDMLTFLMAKQYIAQHHPKMLVLAFGETDEFAHTGRYDMYLQRANDADRMIAELWYSVQSDPFYKHNTVFIITTDHGRGSKRTTWPAHHLFIKGSGEIWMALMGPGIDVKGEIKEAGQIYQNQFAQTIAALLGTVFTPHHPTGKPIVLRQSAIEKKQDALVAAPVIKK